MTAQEIIKQWIMTNPRNEGEDDASWRQRCKDANKNMPGSTFSDAWYSATGLPRPGKPTKSKRINAATNANANEQEPERRSEKMTIVLAPSVARKLRIMCAIDGTKPSAWIERAIMSAPDPQI